MIPRMHSKSGLGRPTRAVAAFAVILLGVLATNPAKAEQEIYLGYEQDACSSVLYVKNRYNQ